MLITSIAATIDILDTWLAWSESHHLYTSVYHLHGTEARDLFRARKEKKMENKSKAERKPVRYLFRATKTVNGVKYYAKDYGKKCFVIPIYE